MTELTDDQREQVRGILNSAPDRVDERLQRLEEGRVVEHKVPSSYRGVGMKCETVAVCKVYERDIAAAQEWFTQAARAYQSAAEAALEQPPFATSHRQVPMTFVEALYASACAGADRTSQEIASTILELDPTDGAEDVKDDIVFKRDKHFFARCLAGAVLDRVEQEDLEELEAVNQEKRDINHLHGQAILDFARGIDADDADLLEQGIGLMLEYHDRQQHEDNVIELIMSPEASALLIVTRKMRYNVEIDSESIPTELVEMNT